MAAEPREKLCLASSLIGLGKPRMENMMLYDYRLPYKAYIEVD